MIEAMAAGSWCRERFWGRGCSRGLQLGTYHNTGYKNGRWRDVVWFEKHIGSFDGVPEPIRPIGQLADREAVLRTI